VAGSLDAAGADGTPAPDIHRTCADLQQELRRSSADHVAPMSRDVRGRAPVGESIKQRVAGSMPPWARYAARRVQDDPRLAQKRSTHRAVDAGAPEGD